MSKTITYTILAGVFSLIFIGMYSAEAATISGTVKFAGSGLSGAKVTAEAISSYVSTITASGGTWSMTTQDTPTYTVDGMKQSFTHVRVTGIVGSQSGIIHNLSTRSTITANYKIAADEEFRSLYGASWKTTAESKLLSSEPWFRDEHTISFAAIAYYDTWDSNDSPPNCDSMVNEARSETGWAGGTYSGADILAVFTAQDIPGASACVNIIPTSGATHPSFITEQTTSNLARTIMHEITHLYGFSHTLTCTNIIPGIMATDASNNSCSASLYITNWVPADDTTLQNRRTWY